MTTPNPDAGHDSSGFSYVMVGITGAIVWDIVNSINAEYRLIRRWSLSTLVYFLSRSATLVAFVLMSIGNTSQVQDCTGSLHARTAMFLLSVSTTSLLFLFRVHAIYYGNRYAAGIFIFLWTCVISGSVAIALAKGSNNGKAAPSDSCSETAVNIITLVITSSILPMALDFIIFLAVTWRLFQNAHVTLTLKHGLKVMMFGAFLPAFSRALLQDSQIYFLCNVVLEIVTLIAFTTPIGTGLSFYTGTSVLVHLAVRNLMACRVYRHTKLQLGSRDVVSSEQSSMAFGAPGTDLESKRETSQDRDVQS
ncbi:hypothetical protein D9613_010298 [Agrocybe pediades]|uniref:Uncharacterized protein n=1 Tax=Agrocybe pediades TaxID=84607 RepID=A0A8H4QG43_9AGAR|nr:hypothetical protein D9613_010298 [Agrocybe pediades]